MITGRTVPTDGDDEPGRKGPRRPDDFGGSPLLAARAAPETTLAAAILNQAINDLNSTGFNRFELERRAKVRGFKSLEIEVEAFLRGPVFTLIADCLHITPRVLRHFVYAHLVNHAKR